MQFFDFIADWQADVEYLHVSTRAEAIRNLDEALAALRAALLRTAFEGDPNGPPDHSVQ